jgi:hypothetical protein
VVVGVNAIRCGHPGRSILMRCRVAIMIAALSVAACASETTGPNLSALNGTWSSGHTLPPVPELTFDLSSTFGAVTGSGAYAATSAQTLACLGGAVNSTGSVTIAASPTSASSFSGTLTFDVGVRAHVDGVVPDAEHVDLTIASSSGSSCSVRLFRGLVP